MTSSPEGRQEAAALDAVSNEDLAAIREFAAAQSLYKPTTLAHKLFVNSVCSVAKAWIEEHSALIPAKPAVEVVEALKAALKPFARIAEMEPNTPDGESAIVNISRCREALAALQAPATPQG